MVQKSDRVCKIAHIPLNRMCSEPLNRVNELPVKGASDVGDNCLLPAFGRRRRRRRKNLFVLYSTLTSQYKLPIGLSEYNNIRKKLNKNHMGKVPSKAANN